MWPVASSDDPEEDMRRWIAPENELPVAVPVNVVLARTDDVAVALTRVQVYTSGVSFELVVRVRPSVVESLGRSLNELFWQHGPGSGQRFLLGIEFSDGRRAATLAGVARDDEIVFHSGGGGGGDTAIDQSWWLNPVPPDGPVRLIARCPDLGIAETAVELDGTALRRTMDDVVTLWPWEPPRERQRDQPMPPPDLPADSWFAR